LYDVLALVLLRDFAHFSLQLLFLCPQGLVALDLLYLDVNRHGLKSLSLDVSCSLSRMLLFSMSIFTRFLVSYSNHELREFPMNSRKALFDAVKTFFGAVAMNIVSEALKSFYVSMFNATYNGCVLTRNVTKNCFNLSQ